MKRFLILTFFLLLSVISVAQTDGISYQAVIIGPDNLELPGVDSEGNYLPTTDVAIKFSIIAPGSGIVEFEEIQNTTTDDFGRINLIIGSENHDDFEKIDWNGDPKSLKVEIDFNNGDGFVDMSVEKLTYVPYVAHRNITASGTLEVDDNTFLNGELNVAGVTNLNSTLNVLGTNTSNLSGDLNVDGETNLNNTLNVTEQSATNLSGALTVGEFNGAPDANAPTTLNGSLEVKGKSTFGDLESTTLLVKESTTLNGVVKIDTDDQIVIESRIHTETINYTNTDDQTDQVIGDDPGKDIANYPLLVQGSTQGIAVEIQGNRRNGNNFVSFWDRPIGSTNPIMWGRIEGEVESEYNNNLDHVFNTILLYYDTAGSTFDVLCSLWDIYSATGEVVSAATSTTAVVGPFPGVTIPIPSLNISAQNSLVAEVLKAAASGAVVGVSVANIITYNDIKEATRGVTYASGAGDYAEYLMRINVNEEMTYGDIVGVVGGKISKNLKGAERLLVVSHKPIVLGNMPQPNRESEYEKVAFMGQVPVKVFGSVRIGDYILPSGKNDGVGIGVHPSKITISQIKDIVGTAWSSNISGFGSVNVAVGLNRNDSSALLEKLDKRVNDQSEEIKYLKNQIDDILVSIASLKEGNTSTDKATSTYNTSNVAGNSKEKVPSLQSIKTEALDNINIEIKPQDIELAFKQAEDILIQSGEYERVKDFFEKIKTDTVFKKDVMDKIKRNVENALQYHKDIAAMAQK